MDGHLECLPQSLQRIANHGPDWLTPVRVFFDRLSCLLTFAIKQTEKRCGGAKDPRRHSAFQMITFCTLTLSKSSLKTEH
jgi:hypothetical protein